MGMDSFFKVISAAGVERGVGAFENIDCVRHINSLTF